jgi:hypothetical protein
VTLQSLLFHFKLNWNVLLNFNESCPVSHLIKILSDVLEFSSRGQTDGQTDIADLFDSAKYGYIFVFEPTILVFESCMTLLQRLVCEVTRNLNKPCKAVTSKLIMAHFQLSKDFIASPFLTLRTTT